MSDPTTIDLDPVTLEVIRNALPAISDEMSNDLQRTSYNMMIYEVRDYCAALVDTRGRLISQNVGGVSHFVADLGVVITDAMGRYGAAGFRQGDVLLHNHQATAGQHLNNMVVYTPVFHGDHLVAFAMVRAHWVDVGGLSTGFTAASATDPWSEGLQFNQVKIYDGGVPETKLLDFIRDNIRYPDSSMGDMRSQLAACRLGGRRFAEMLERYGEDIVLRSIEQIYAETEAKCRAAVEKIPDGVYLAESQIDAPDAPFEIKVRVIIAGSEMTIDLSDCSPQRAGSPFNARTYAGAYIAYKALTGPLEPLNEGAFSALKVIIPEGNMMMARFPALMAGWSVALPTVVDTIWRAFAGALPERIPAAHSGSLGAAISFFGVDPRTRKRFVLMTIESGGWGGRPTEDGEDASMSVCQGDVRNAPIENIELKTPVLVVARALRADSGGAGLHRGGLGVSTRVRALVPGRWHLGLDTSRYSCAPWGLHGGASGVIARTLVKDPGDDTFRTPKLQLHDGEAGTEVIFETAGGGGWGNPLSRDPTEVMRDVMEGYISPQAALANYGVALTDDLTAVDEVLTRHRRAELAG